MPTLQTRILQLLTDTPGLSDRQIADILLGASASQQSVNQACRSLESQDKIRRLKKPDGRLGNYLPDDPTATDPTPTREASPGTADLSEDTLKRCLVEWLSAQGWAPVVAWGAARGIDIDAFKEGRRWIIEVKGQGSRDAMRVNYFLAILGETLQRMSDPDAKYSIALPDIPQFRNLWSRLPPLAKSRTQIMALFVDNRGNVDEVM